MLEIGQIIDGKYKILNVIGKGGMSVVYLAMNEKANKQWAIKEVRKDGKQDFDVVKQGLVAEIDMLKRFNHPNLPSIVDVIDGDGTFLIVMDYIEGNALDKKLQEEGAQNQADVIEWSKQLCDVLGYLHSRKPPIIYRDMKPSNVMLKPDGTVTLIDFGTAREFKYAGVADTTCLGTRGYAAPEQFGGQGQTDARTDIYCLGATMYHLVTGHNPGVYPYKMYPIRQWNSLLSSGLEEIILKCTQQNPEERYQTCAELMYALEHYQDLDTENKKAQTVKWRTVLTTSVLTFAMAGGAVGFKALEKSKTSDTYDNYLVTASTAPAEEAYKLYDKAIELKPDDPKAYKELWKYFKNNDGYITQDEYYQFTKLVPGTSEKPREKSFKDAHPADYALFCYDVGRDYYFYYNDSTDTSESDSNIRRTGAQYAYGWLSKISDYDKLQSGARSDGRKDAGSIKEKASIITNMSKFLKDGGTSQANAEGYYEYSYLDYWNDYTSMVDMQLESTETVTIALSVYKNFAIAVYMKPDEFLKVKEKDEITAEFERITGFVDDVSSYPTYIQDKNGPEAENVKAQINATLQKVESAANQKGGTE